jgi:heptosyltransferase-1
MEERCLIVKTSSLGDIIHILPAISEAKKHVPNLLFDWVVEKKFYDIVSCYPNIDNIITVEIHKWRKNIFRAIHEIKEFKRILKKFHYEYIIDAQGLLKSAWITSNARGIKYGFDRDSAKESLSSWAYNKKIYVKKDTHAIMRLKKLFAAVFNYQPDYLDFNYGLQYQWQKNKCLNQIVFLHSTTWSSKYWYLPHWQKLAKYLDNQGINILLPWADEEGKVRSQQIAAGLMWAKVLPKLTINKLAEIFVRSQAVVAVDTGLAHLAAACKVPTVVLYGSTSKNLTGAKGAHVAHISSLLSCSPCLKRVCPITRGKFSLCNISISALDVYHQVNFLINSI